ncbi:hypothetical protein AB0O28_14805 [Microbispora sp. NPDC088329]
MPLNAGAVLATVAIDAGRACQATPRIQAGLFTRLTIEAYRYDDEMTT